MFTIKMSNTNDLYQLIKSLEKNEIIYFRKEMKTFVGDSKSVNYMVLFNKIIKSKSSDEAAIKIGLPPNIVSNYSRIKGYLYKQILRSLRNYYSDRDIKVVVYNLIVDFIILNNRGLLVQAEKIVTKVEKLIKGANQTSFDLIACKMRYYINNKKDSYSAIKTLAGDLQNNAENIELTSNFLDLIYQLKIEVETPSSEKAIDFNQLDFFHSELADKNIEISIHKNSIQALSADKNGELEKAFQFLSENVKLVEANPKYQKFTPFALSKMLYNLYMYAEKMSNHSAMGDILIKMEKGFEALNGFVLKYEETYNRFLFYKCKGSFMLFTDQTTFDLVEFESAIIPWYKINSKYESAIDYYFVRIFCFYFFLQNNERKFQKWTEEYTSCCFKTKNFNLLYEIKILGLILIKSKKDAQKWVDLEIKNLKTFKNNYKIKSSKIETIIIKSCKSSDSYEETVTVLNSLITTLPKASELEIILHRWSSVSN